MLLTLLAEVGETAHVELLRLLDTFQIHSDVISARGPFVWRGAPLADRCFFDGRTSGFAGPMDGARERELRAWLDGREGDYRISRGLRAETVAHRMPAIGRGVCPECNSKKILYLPAYDKEDHGDQIACGACGGMFAANVLLKSDLLHLFINSDRVETCLCFDPSVLGDEFTIGRSSKHCRLTAKRETFSRRHCAISWSEGRFWLEDCESTGGTWLNGKMLRHAQPLKSGDILSPDSDMRIRIAVVSRD